MNKKPDISKAKLEFGHNPTTPLEVGVPRTIEWMKQVYGIGSKRPPYMNPYHIPQAKATAR